MDENAQKRQKRLDALQTAAVLHPLSLACVLVADALVRELLSEVADESHRAGVSMVPCTDEVRPLLEGARSWLARNPRDARRPLRFDVVAYTGTDEAEWLRNAIEVSA